MSRESFLRRVRAAVAAGNSAGQAPGLPERGTVGYQGAGPDLIGRLRDELTAAGAHLHVVPDSRAAVEKLLALVQEHSARRILLGSGTVLDPLDLAGPLRDVGLTVDEIANLSKGHERAAFFAADVGISGVDHLVAETGTIVLYARPLEPRSLSLLPPVHLVVAHRRQILPDLFELFNDQETEMPSCVSLITGPSKTGDIELRLVTGVHGPGEVHIVLIDELCPA